MTTIGLLGVNPTCSLAIAILQSELRYDRIVLFDDDPVKLGQQLRGYEVVGTSDDVEPAVRRGHVDTLVICIGSQHLEHKKHLYERYRASGVDFARVVHRAAIVDESAMVGPGCILGPSVVLGVGATVGENVVIWSGAVVEHDSVIGGHSYIGPNASLSGFVRVGGCTLVGTGAVVLPNVRIGSRCVVGAGAVVTRDVGDGATVVGVPARART